MIFINGTTRPHGEDLRGGPDFRIIGRQLMTFRRVQTLQIWTGDHRGEKRAVKPRHDNFIEKLYLRFQSTFAAALLALQFDRKSRGRGLETYKLKQKEATGFFDVQQLTNKAC